MLLEAEAVLFGFQVAQQVEYLPMIIESDSTKVVELVWSRKSSLTEVSWTVEEINGEVADNDDEEETQPCSE